MPDHLPDDHATFGPCIAVRGTRLQDKIVFFPVAGAFFVVGCGALVGGPYIAGFQWLGWFAIAVGIASLAAAYYTFRQAVSGAEFYQEGAVETRLYRRREFAFADITEFRYVLVRQYSHNQYVGTAVTIRMLDSSGRRFVFSGMHNEREVRYTLNIRNRQYTGEDELDVVRDIIAAEVAKTLLRQLHEHGEVQWTPSGCITIHGVIPIRDGKRLDLVPWSQIEEASFGEGVFALFDAKSQHSFLALAVNANNFYPGLELFKTLIAR